MKNIVSGIIGLLFIFTCQAQNLYFKHLGIADGLSQVRIQTMYQDEIGAVWLGVYPNEERIKTMRPVFDIPDEIEIFCLLSFGYPEFKKTAKDRWDGSRVHNGRWNQ